ncbi:MAG: hypothetical protein NTU91_04140 [Chloroflexi bacterium]|nr:hypothetical protein [Chloroflexota bacterium]
MPKQFHCPRPSENDPTNIRPILAAALCLVPSALAAQDLVVDAVRNCVYYGDAVTLAQRAALPQLQQSPTYQVTVSGEAYLSDQTGAQADPFPGVILAYATNEEDGFAMRYRVARPGDSFEFCTPSCFEAACWSPVENPFF